MDGTNTTSTAVHPAVASTADTATASAAITAEAADTATRADTADTDTGYKAPGEAAGAGGGTGSAGRRTAASTGSPAAA
jgi:hypothetical protein